MEYRGHVENGKVVLDEPEALPDGTPVSVRPIGKPRKHAAGRRRARNISAGLAKLAGSVKDLPPDAARNLDHYLYGHPRR